MLASRWISEGVFVCLLNGYIITQLVTQGLFHNTDTGVEPAATTAFLYKSTKGGYHMESHHNTIGFDVLVHACQRPLIAEYLPQVCAVFYSPPHILVGLPGLRKVWVDSGDSG